MLARIIVYIFVLFPIIVNGQKTSILFDSLSHNFKNIRERGGVVYHIFSFENTGKKPLFIRKVRSGCGCTSHTWTKKPIQPGEKGSIKVEFNPLHRPGLFVNSIIINTNTKENVYTLTIRGNVIWEKPGPFDKYKKNVGGLKLNKDILDLGTFLHTKEKTDSIKIGNPTSNILLLKVLNRPKGVNVKFKTDSLKPNTGSMLSISIGEEYEKWGNFEDKIKFSVNDTINGCISIKGERDEDFSILKDSIYKNPKAEFSHREINFGKMRKGRTKSKYLYVKNTGDSPLFIRDIENKYSHIKLKVSNNEVEPGEKIKITIKYTGIRSKEKTFPITFRFNAPKQLKEVINIKTN